MTKLTAIPPTILVTALTAFLGGGLAGSIFDWYVNRPEAATITYIIKSTILAELAKSTIPNLTIKLGEETVQSLFTNTIEFTAQNGPYIDSMEVAITFPEKVRIYGLTSDVPSALHEMVCKQLDNGARCRLSPIDMKTAGSFKVSISTDKKLEPSVLTTAKGVELLAIDQFIERKSGLLSFLRSPKVIIFSLASALYFLIFPPIIFRLLRKAIRPAVVGKVLDPSGRPVSGAQIELELDSPRTTYSPVQTDQSGDFIFGILRKQSFLSGRMRITHPNFPQTEFSIDSPIVVQTIGRAQ